LVLALGVTVSLVTWSAALRAEGRARLVYVRTADAEGCPAELDLRLRVMARLGYDPFSPQASRVVMARVEIDGTLLGGRVELVDERGLSRGVRTMTSPRDRCEELVRAMALSISLAIDPDRVDHFPPTSRPAVASQTDGVATALPTTPEQKQPAARAVRLAPLRLAPLRTSAPHWNGGIALAAGARILPGFALGAFGSLGYRAERWTLAIEPGALGSYGRSLPGGGRLEGVLFGSKLSLCWEFGGGAAACGVGVAAAQRLSSSGVFEPRASTGAFLGAGARLVFRAPLRAGVEFLFGVEGLTDLTRNSARFSNRNVWTAPLVSGQGLIGVDSHFW
jgi:hypothetical protein